MLVSKVSNICAFGKDAHKDTGCRQPETKQKKYLKDDFVQRIGFYRMLELASCVEDNKKQREVSKKYENLLSELADRILEDDYNGIPFNVDGIEESICFPVSDSLKEFLDKHKNLLVSKGCIQTVKHPQQCLITGEMIGPNELFLQMRDGSSESVSLAACDIGNVINMHTAVCCYKC